MVIMGGMWRIVGIVENGENEGSGENVGNGDN